MTAAKTSPDSNFSPMPPTILILIALFVALGCIAFVLGIWHNARCREKKRTWVDTEGTIVEIIQNYDENNPEIEYQVEGETRKFRSKENTSAKVGDKIPITYDPNSDRAEIIDKENEFFTSTGFFGAALAFWGGAIGLWKVMN